jgi:hypothetical protein
MNSGSLKFDSDTTHVISYRFTRANRWYNASQTREYLVNLPYITHIGIIDMDLKLGTIPITPESYISSLIKTVHNRLFKRLISWKNYDFVTRYEIELVAIATIYVLTGDMRFYHKSYNVLRFSPKNIARILIYYFQKLDENTKVVSIMCFKALNGSVCAISVHPDHDIF